MESVTISVKNGPGKEDIYDILSRDESGFEIDFSTPPPLHTGIDIAIGVAGIVLSAAQLGGTIYQIMQAKAASEPPVVVVIVRDDGKTVSLSGTTPQQIESELLPLTGD